MRILRRLLLSALIGVVALELILQVGAFATSFTISTTPTAAATNASILCIGDSYTYGLGSTATTNSYPGALQRLLTARDPAAPEVVNAGWPGQNSREALLRLEAQLEQYRPRLVCVLIGLNDTWTRPEPLSVDELAEPAELGFVWRFRTWRLLRLMFGREQAAVPTPLAVTAGDGVTEQSPADANDPAVQAVALVRSGQHDAAITRLERAIEENPRGAPEYHQGLVQILTSLGRRGQAARSLEWLRQRHADAPTAEGTEAFATALAAVGNRSEAAAIAVAGTAAFPQNSSLWWIAGQYHYDAGDFPTAERELDAALSCADPDNRAWRATLHRDLAKTCCDRDSGKAIENLLAAMRLDRDVERCRIIVEGSAEAFPPATIERCLAELQTRDGDLELLQRLFGSGGTDRAAMCDVLTGHLQQIVGLSQARGSRVVVLGYPLQVADLEAAQRGVAQAASVRFVPCMPAFAAKLDRVPRNALYTRDDHCTDAGYALMAETALPAVLAALK